MHRDFFRNSKMRGQDGFVLLEVLASMSLFAFIVFGYLRLVNLFDSGVRNMDLNNEVSLTMARVTSTFGDDDRFCTAILGGKNLDPLSATGTQIQKIEFHNLDGTPQNIPPVLNLSGNFVNKDPGTSNQSLGLNVMDIRLKPVTPAIIQDVAISNAQIKNIMASLEITFTKVGGSIGTTVRNIPIFALLDASNNVTKCSTSSSFYILREQLCQTKTGGYSHVEYDSAGNPICVDNSTIKIFSAPGTAGSVSCGAGYHVAIAANNLTDSEMLKIVCNAYSGATAINSRTYNTPNGQIVSNGPTTVFIPHLNYPTNTCTFDVDVSIPLSSYTYNVRCTSN